MIVSLGSEVIKYPLEDLEIFEAMNNRMQHRLLNEPIFDLIVQGRSGGKSMLFYNEFKNSLPEYKLMKSKSKQSRCVNVCVKHWTGMFTGETK